MPLARAAAVSSVGLLLLVVPWPAPMVGLAFLFGGALLGISAARGRKQRSPARSRAPRI